LANELQERSDAGDERPFLTKPALLILLLLSLVVVTTLTEQYRDPIGEKYLPLLAPGSADFSMTFSGARALVRGEDPYHNRLPELRDPWGRGIELGGKFYNVLYPPSQLLFYVPLAKLIDDPRLAGRLFFRLNLLLLLGLAVVTWWLLAGVRAEAPRERQLSIALVPLLFVLLSCNVGSLLGLERGQSDIVGAALCWGAVALHLRGWRFVPAFFTASVFLMKGYSLVLGLGLALLAERRDVKRLLGGGLLAVALLLLPVLEYVDEGMTGTRWSASRFTGRYWYNHGFKNLFNQISPSAAEPGRIALTALCLLAALLFWWNARRGPKPQATLWTSLFAAAALLAPIGYAAGSFIYNQILILPGVLLFLLRGRDFAEACALPEPGWRLLAGSQAVVALTLFTFKLGSETLPVAAIGYVVLILAWLAGLLWRTRTAGRA
jgi:hypothetical protein